MQILKKYGKGILAGGALFAGVLTAPSLASVGKSYYTNHQFEIFTEALFAADVSSNALNLHYTLANPEDFGIVEYSTSLGTFDPKQISAGMLACENRRVALREFPLKELNRDNQLTYDILCLAYETELLPGNNYLLEEYISPSLGMQAQLPVLLAEYTFRKEQDVQDYLKLLASVDTYFEGILEFEKLKSQNGTFMSDRTADRIISQCSDFIRNPEDNYLLSVFSEKISDLSGLSEKKKEAYSILHEKVLKNQVLPSYQRLIDGLYLLKGTGKNAGGLCGFTGGKAYYEYLLKSSCGMYESVSEIQTRLLKQLQLDMNECGEIIECNPQMLKEISSGDTVAAAVKKENSPKQILETLRKEMNKDFPEVSDAVYEVKYVPEALEAYLSPAFYLTPPIDTLSPNDIYINPYAKLGGIQLFTTLAHEGFPGHMYQTIYFASTDPSHIRYTLNMGGYVEGWATYIETYAYGYFDQDADLSRLEWLNRSLNLCILSLLDTGIHYDGWDRIRSAEFLSNFGITSADAQEEIYQVIVEDPANYLKYYMGYLHFLDLREEQKQKEGKEFDLREFHKKILEIGPCQFPILEKYL